jgi:hypothetical protein
VQATRRVVTIDDVIAANGVRSPVAGTKTSFSLGIVLVVGQNETDAEVALDEATFDPVAADLAPAFHRATGLRGTLDVISHSTDAAGGAGGGGAGGAGGAATSTTSTGGAPPSKDTSSGCTLAGSSDDSGDLFGLASVGAAALLVASRRRSSR